MGRTRDSVVARDGDDHAGADVVLFCAGVDNRERRVAAPAGTRPVAPPGPRRKVVGMIRNITVDGEDALAVDTAEELGRALRSGQWVVAPPEAYDAYGLPWDDADNTDALEDVLAAEEPDAGTRET